MYQLGQHTHRHTHRHTQTHTHTHTHTHTDTHTDTHTHTHIHTHTHTHTHTHQYSFSSLRWSILERGLPGLVATLFWCMSAVWLNLCIVSWNNPQWWWGVKGGRDIADLVIYCLQYVFASCVVICGVVYPCVRRTFLGSKWRRRRRQSDYRCV